MTYQKNKNKIDLNRQIKLNVMKEKHGHGQIEIQCNDNNVQQLNKFNRFLLSFYLFISFAFLIFIFHIGFNALNRIHPFFYEINKYLRMFRPKYKHNFFFHPIFVYSIE